MTREQFRCPRCRRWLRGREGESVRCPMCGAEGRAPTLAEDAAKMIAQHCAEIVSAALRPEERQAAFEEFLVAAQAGVEAALILQARRGPSIN